MKIELQKTDKAIERQQIVDDLERRMDGVTISGDKDLDIEMRSFSLLRALQSQIGANVDAGREKEISNELARREGRSTDGILVPYGAIFEQRADVMTTAAPASGPGSNLIGTEYLAGQYIDLLRENDPLASLGIRHLTGLQGNVEIPKALTGTSVGWFAENTNISATDMSFESVQLAPKHLGALAEISRNMILQSSPDIEGLLKSDLSQAMALEIARTVLGGTGTNNQPRGILYYADIQTMDEPSDVMDFVPELVALLFESNISNVQFVGASSFKKIVDKLLTTDGLPVGETAFFRNTAHIWTSLLPEGMKLLAGDFSQVLVGHWGSVELLVNPYAELAYRKGNVLTRIVTTLDVAVRHEEAFASFGV